MPQLHSPAFFIIKPTIGLELALDDFEALLENLRAIE
jgi:hypothetical protein